MKFLGLSGPSGKKPYLSDSIQLKAHAFNWLLQAYNYNSEISLLTTFLSICFSAAFFDPNLSYNITNEYLFLGRKFFR